MCLATINRIKEAHAQIYNCVSQTKNGGFYFKNQKYICNFFNLQFNQNKYLIICYRNVVVLIFVSKHKLAYHVDNTKIW